MRLGVLLARTVVGVTLCFFAGTVAHELTHFATAHLTGAEVESVRYLPPAPEVVYDAPSARADQLIKGAPIALTIPVFVAVVYLSRNARLPVTLSLVAFAMAYLPRSDSDWQAITEVVR